MHKAVFDRLSIHPQNGWAGLFHKCFRRSFNIISSRAVPSPEQRGLGGSEVARYATLCRLEESIKPLHTVSARAGCTYVTEVVRAGQWLKHLDFCPPRPSQPKLDSGAPAPADRRIERLGDRQRINRNGA